jgi:uncharacterized protein YbaR (Trm112 family)
MFVELIEALRCPRAHAESALIVSVDRSEARHIVDGTLGCPVCRAEFPISNGEAVFDETAPIPAAAAPDAATAMRLAAFLELTDARGFAVLHGSWGAHMPALATLTQTSVLLVNPPRGVSDHGAGTVRVADRLPLAPGSARAAALDTATLALSRAMTRAVRVGGRLVGPAALPLPEAAREIARDERMWVAEKTAAPDESAPLVTLRRA